MPYLFFSLSLTHSLSLSLSLYSITSQSPINIYYFSYICTCSDFPPYSDMNVTLSLRLFPFLFSLSPLPFLFSFFVEVPSYFSSDLFCTHHRILDIVHTTRGGSEPDSVIPLKSLRRSSRPLSSSWHCTIDTYRDVSI